MGFSRPGTKDGLGTFRTPFSAHRYKDIQMELSHVTLAQRARVFAALGIDNDTLAIDGIQIGILGGVRAGSTGVLLMDDFVSFKYPPAAATAVVTQSRRSQAWVAGTR